MSISGSLEDVAVADVLQFVSLGKRTGTLELECDGERARLGFHEGTLVSAQAPGAARLGNLLLDSGRVGANELHQAIRLQQADPERRSLGQILVEQGLLAPETLQQFVKIQLEHAVAQVVRWDRGSFEFSPDEIRPVDDIGMDADQLLPGTGMAANVVLLEAARIFDERDHRPADDGEAAAAIDGLIEEETLSGVTVEPELSSGPEVRALSTDREFVRRLRRAFARHGRVRRVTLGRAAEPPGEGESDLVLVDVRPGGLDPEGLMLLHSARPEARMVVLVDSPAALQDAYRRGAVAVVPPEVDTVCAALINLLESEPAAPAIAPPASLAESGLRRLQRVFGELRSGLASATVALNLMQAISESFERAVLLLVKQDRLAALGAFGLAADGGPLALAVRRLELAPEGALAEALASSQVHLGSYVEAGLPAALERILGAPANGQIVLFPVAGAERVIAVVYADNGPLVRPMRDVDLLEVAAAQVGIAFENELLRRQLRRSGS